MIAPVSNNLASAAAPIALSRERSFDLTLRKAAAAHDEKAVREAVTKLVSSALVEPVLAQMRESTLAAGPFAPGDAERRFGPLLDQHVADRVVSSANFGAIDVMVRNFMDREKPRETQGNQINAGA